MDICIFKISYTLEHDTGSVDIFSNGINMTFLVSESVGCNLFPFNVIFMLKSRDFLLDLKIISSGLYDLNQFFVNTHIP